MQYRFRSSRQSIAVPVLLLCLSTLMPLNAFGQAGDLFLAPVEESDPTPLEAPLTGPAPAVEAEEHPTAAAAAQGTRQARGLLEADQEALIAAEIAGRILELPFEEGQSFNSGDLLVELDCALVESQRDQARATLRAAQVTLNTNRQLQQLGSIGQLDVALSEADVIEAGAALEGAEVQVEKCQVFAPFDGRVVSTAINPFESVNPGDPLLDVVSDGSLSVRLIVPSRWLAWLAPGDGFNFLVDETGDLVPATIRALGARVDSASQTVPAFGTLIEDPERLIAGMSGTAIFWTGADDEATTSSR